MFLTIPATWNGHPYGRPYGHPYERPCGSLPGALQERPGEFSYPSWPPGTDVRKDVHTVLPECYRTDVRTDARNVCLVTVFYFSDVTDVISP